MYSSQPQSSIHAVAVQMSRIALTLMASVVPFELFQDPHYSVYLGIIFLHFINKKLECYKDQF